MSKSPENVLSRNRDLYRTYEAVLKKYGELSTSIKKRTIYTEVAGKWHLDWQTVSRIICHMEKHPDLKGFD
jgi:hypothetical protein